MREALQGITVVDLSVNAPGPFASKMLLDLGATVISIVNPAGAPEYSGANDDPMLSARGGPHDALSKGKSTLRLDLKTESGRTELFGLLETADVLVSEMRPGKLEALGFGWTGLAVRNARLILCEICGYGSKGPRSTRAGHDINYLSLSGALSLIRDADGKPIPPQNILGDYAAGGCLAVTGILAALVERETTGKGRHLEVSMTDGVRYLMSDITAATLLAGHPEESWRNTLSGGMPTYDTYETADGGWIAVGALEPKFIRVLGNTLEWPELLDLMAQKSTWPLARKGLAERFRRKSQNTWDQLFADCDACVTPVLSLDRLDPDKAPDLCAVLGSTSPGQ
ncbi:CoA transferase [Pararhizobium sp. YC-54]|uniref:CaiB/BaiF CoA transferase family protein n=1 Tax=Pararhizobium sp. YC-54 TaxID=2986920 RepID=UPI0021F6F8E9|nr:CaiB/BaiF CoA-transferase family protein [Pararhizobium sp. YC-54]MCW0001759.1 CoA transferase [Pararhizobium sp. YC-54]